jgi:plasmid stabilization system protein ParE
MDFRVEITGPAIADLAEIVSYIAQENPAAAKALGENLLDAALSLAKTPFKGSRYQMLADVRKLTLPPFKIFYRVNDRTRAVQILRFWHSARREPKLGPGIG